jgi:hypothetical protein
MWVRYLASVDDTEYGRAALAYLKGLLRYAPVRLIPQTAPPSTAWAPVVRYLLSKHTAPNPPRYLNVVCTPPERWTWMQVVSAPTRKGTPEVIRGRLELHTAGVRNVLIAIAPPSEAHQIETAKKYDAVIVQGVTRLDAWQQLGITPHVLTTQQLQDESDRAGWRIFTE